LDTLPAIVLLAYTGSFERNISFLGQWSLGKVTDTSKVIVFVVVIPGPWGKT
jgi:hypothetical protein